MTTPLPGRTAANDQLIMSTPYDQLTQRQKDYADLYGLTLQAPTSGNPANVNGPNAPGGTSYVGTATGTSPDATVATPVAVAPPATAPLTPTAPPTVPSSAASTAPTADQRDAARLIGQELASYGLTSPDLSDWAWKEIVSGKSSNEVLLDLRQRPEFKAAFPEIDARQKAGLAPLSPGDIVSYRNEARQLYRAAGLPPGFFDSDQALADLMVKNVSLSELSQRITDAAQEAYNTPPEDQAQFQALFGHGGLTAMFFNPDIAEPLLRKQLAAAGLSGSGVRSGFGALTADQALNLTDKGVTQAQADQGFATLQHQQELFTPLDAGETAISRQEQIDAGLGGNQAAQDRIQNRARRRVATFAGGGQFAGGSTGLAGFGGSGG